MNGIALSSDLQKETGDELPSKAPQRLLEHPTIEEESKELQQKPLEENENTEHQRKMNSQPRDQ